MNYRPEVMSMRLKRIRDRYFRETMKHPEGDIVHHGDCETHRAMEIYKYAPCTCGLLHDLRLLEYSIMDKIFPNYGEDYARQEAAVPGAGQKSSVDLDEFIEKTFPGFKVHVTQPPNDNMDWALISEVFGTDFRERMKKNYKSRE